MIANSISRTKFEENPDKSFFHVWVIENFQQAFEKQYTEYYSIISKEFLGAGRKWELHIVARENTSFKLSGVYLKLKSFKEGETSVQFNWNVSFLDGNNKVIFLSSKTNYTFRQIGGWGDTDIINKNLISNNNLIVRLDAEENFEGLKYTHETESVVLQDSNELLKLSNDIYNCQNEPGNFSDFEIVAVDDENKSFPVHKFILKARSEYFSKLFDSGMKENLEGKILIENTTAETIGRMIDYFYSGEIKEQYLTLEELFDLFIIADKYILEGLKFICEKRIIEKINLHNAAQIHLFAVDYPTENIKKFIEDYCSKNIEKLKDLDEFQSQVRKRPSDFIDFLVPTKRQKKN